MLFRYIRIFVISLLATGGVTLFLKIACWEQVQAAFPACILIGLATVIWQLEAIIWSKED